MTRRAAFKQVEIERIIRAAQKCGAVVEIDLRTMKVHIVPDAGDSRATSLNEDRESIGRFQIASDGEENWDGYD